MFQDPQGAHRVAGVPVTDMAWIDHVIEGDDLGSMIFEGCTFERTKFVGTSLWGTIFVNCRIDDCDFVGCKLFRTQINQCEITRLRLREGEEDNKGELAEMTISSTDIEELEINQRGRQLSITEGTIGKLSFNAAGAEQEALTMSGAKCAQVFAENVRWKNATAIGCDLRQWAIEGARFERCAFIKTNADGMDLSSVHFELCNLYQASLKEAKIRSAQTTIFSECDCEDTDFEGAKLANCLFSNINGKRTRYQGANLEQAMFPYARLHEADFSRSHAPQSVWAGAHLVKTNLEGMDAKRSSWRNAKLEDVNTQNASFVEADLHGVEDELSDADTRDSRRGIKWREEVEKEAKAGTGPKP